MFRKSKSKEFQSPRKTSNFAMEMGISLNYELEKKQICHIHTTLITSFDASFAWEWKSV